MGEAQAAIFKWVEKLGLSINNRVFNHSNEFLMPLEDLI